MVHEMDGKCKQGQPRMKWKEQHEKNWFKKRMISVGGEKM